jgi:hypothetical protein
VKKVDANKEGEAIEGNEEEKKDIDPDNENMNDEDIKYDLNYYDLDDDFIDDENIEIE